MAEIKEGAPLGPGSVHDGADRIRAKDSHGYAVTVTGRLRKEDLTKIIDYINDIRYGSVTVIIQDGNVLQIEKNEKIRLR
jgi:hypothetical protein